MHVCCSLVCVLKRFPNGNAVDVRSGSFSTRGTALPRVPPRNYTCFGSIGTGNSAPVQPGKDRQRNKRSKPSIASESLLCNDIRQKKMQKNLTSETVELKDRQEPAQVGLIGPGDGRRRLGRARRSWRRRASFRRSAENSSVRGRRDGVRRPEGDRAATVGNGGSRVGGDQGVDGEVAGAAGTLSARKENIAADGQHAHSGLFILPMGQVNFRTIWAQIWSRYIGLTVAGKCRTLLLNTLIRLLSPNSSHQNL